MYYSGTRAYTKGKTYICNDMGFLPDEEGDEYHSWTNDAIPKYFKLIETMNYKVTRQQMKEIYDIACSTWKPKIKALTEKYIGALDDEGELPEEVVKEMKSAATTEQKPLIDRIFPQPQDNNAFVGQFELGYLHCISEKLFGNPYTLQIGVAQAPDNLKRKSFYIPPNYEVALSSGVNGNGTIIEIKKK